MGAVNDQINYITSSSIAAFGCRAAPAELYLLILAIRPTTVHRPRASGYLPVDSELSGSRPIGA